MMRFGQDQDTTQRKIKRKKEEEEERDDIMPGTHG
jgi:hypothetical protein